MNIRAFFALPLKNSTVRRLADHADSLCHLDVNCDVLWVDSDNYHLTLCFLGDISLEQVNRLEALAANRLADVGSFPVQLSVCEYYCVNKQLALIAALADTNEKLMTLRSVLIDLVESAGIESEQQDFKPHVTLGRVDAKCQFYQPECWPAVDLLSVAGSVVLYQSKAGAKGSIYTPLFELPLDSESL